MIRCSRETQQYDTSCLRQDIRSNTRRDRRRNVTIMVPIPFVVLVLINILPFCTVVHGFQNTNDNGYLTRKRYEQSSRFISSARCHNRHYSVDDMFAKISIPQYSSSMSLHASMKNDDDENNNSNRDISNSFNIFDSLQQFFMGNSNQMFGKSNTPNTDIPTETTICTIPAQHVKKGGLRLFLMFYLMGMQNTPDKSTWRVYEMQSSPKLGYETNQKSSSSSKSNEEPLGIEYYFYDNSAVLTIVLESDMVRIMRRLPTNGSIISQPSNTYIMQESIIVDGILNELEQCAHDDTVPSTNRLLLLREQNPNAIAEAKEMLSFG